MGGSDCELLGAGWLAQPVNAVSSLAYLVAAVAVVASRRGEVLRSPMLLSGVVALGVVAAGSFVFHGPQPSWGDGLHDSSIAALLVVYLFLGTRSPAAVAGAAVAAAAAVAIVAAAPSTVLLVHGGLVVAAVGLEWWRWKGGLAAPPGVLAVLCAGIVLLVLGRTDGPLCGPTSLAQAHAGWHLLSAAAAGLALVDRRRPNPGLGKRCPSGGGGSASARGWARAPASRGSHEGDSDARRS